LPLSDRCLVLPNVAVAELIGFQAGSPVLASPEWLLGWIDWRGQRLPLLSFESACGGQLQVGERARIVVLNALGSSPLRFV
ncbi:chemotaxis protein CheW, partial [Pseudomonas frederiksbergensis]|nr:chemotaxis protein CheW [Pseudomonas frederiksbergensis]